MTLIEAFAVLLAGAAAGGVNAIVGSGSLITFPTLMAVGYSPVVANVTNCVGLVPGGVSGSFAYRRELRGQWRRIGKLAIGTTIGAVIGGILLLELPDTVFDTIVPILILLAVALMALRPSPKPHAGGRRMAGGVASTFATGIYGGYFGAAQGIILVSLLRLTLADDLQVVNAIKNVLVGLANAIAGILFIAVADIAWEAAALIAVGSFAGGHLGARYGRRIPSEILRRVVIVYGVIVAAILLVK